MPGSSSMASNLPHRINQLILSKSRVPNSRSCQTVSTISAPISDLEGSFPIQAFIYGSDACSEIGKPMGTCGDTTPEMLSYLKEFGRS